MVTRGRIVASTQETPARGVADAPGQAAASIWPASVATEHEKSSRHERTRRSLRVFECSGERRAVLSLRCLSDDEVICLSRVTTPVDEVRMRVKVPVPLQFTEYVP